VSDNPYEAPDAAVEDRARVPGEPITAAMIESMGSAGPWGRFLAVIGFLSVGLFACSGVGMLGVGLMAATVPEMEEVGAIGGVAMAGLSLFYFVLGALYLLPSLQLNRFAGAASRTKHGGGAESMADALNNMRAFLKTVSIMFIVGIVLYILMIAGLMIAGIFFNDTLGGV